MGLDSSGNGNNWTLNNFNVSTANTSYDIMIDVPEDQAGANTRGNFCTLNPLEYAGSGFTSITNGNLDATFNGYYWTAACGTLAVPNTGKWYYEFTGSGWSTSSNWPNVFCGFLKAGVRLATDPSDTPNSALCGIYIRNDSSPAVRFYDFNNNPFSTTAVSTPDAGDGTYMIAIDFDNNKLYLGVNGTWYGSGDPNAGTNGYSITNPGDYVRPMYMMNPAAGGTLTSYLNFGQRPFAYTPPSGYKSLNTFNLPEPTIKQPNRHFDAITRNGFGSSGGSVTSLNFQPDFLWEKARSTASNNTLIDSIRGVTKELFSNLTNAESTGSNFLVSFNSNGFTMGSNDWGTSTTVVDWIWNAGGANTTNTSGSVTSIVRANPTSGFSVVTFTAPSGSTAYTVGHGLGTTPAMIIVKDRGAAGNDWYVWHKGYSNTAQGNQRLNTTAAVGNSSSVWNNTAPTDTVFSSLSGTAVSSSTTAVAYCFAEIAGYSAFGRYTGNGSSNGPFVFTGFRPRFVMVKRTTSTGAWCVYDTSRNTYNVADLEINLNSSAAENSGNALDVLSNGFKWRDSFGAHNAVGVDYIYMAFAEHPFKNALAR
jgi:hypothetical protein